MVAETNNDERVLAFSGDRVRAWTVRSARDYPVRGRTIVVNTGVAPAAISAWPAKRIPFLSSTVLVDVHVESADSLVLLQVEESAEPASITGEPGWRHLSTEVPSFPAETPLWRSPQDEIGVVGLAPAALLDGAVDDAGAGPFQVRVNLWFAPAGTDCGIHNEHDFIEVHTQVHGLGRMQKFREHDHSSCYEDVLMSPGYTTPDPFCTAQADGSFGYPWHQYYADTDCIWLAVEYHRCA